MENGGISGKQSVAYVVKSQARVLSEGPAPDCAVRIADMLLHTAIVRHASDIHCEPERDNMRVRYRIDGILHLQKPISHTDCSAVISRVKILSGLDIAQRRLPQDGKVLIRFYPDDSDRYRDIDVRVSTFPSVYGEKMVIRVLDREQRGLGLDDLGCSQCVYENVHQLLAQSQGFFLVTGPTGSGKTTTLYAMLSQLNTLERNIVTMEDPVEYHIDGITQSQINDAAGFTFDRALRALLRQDPDVAMVGEIRDKQSAQIAIESALTGHLVLSTLHTNNAVGVITRLRDMGVEPFLITASLTGVLAQRLIRVLCVHCKKETPLSAHERKWFALRKWSIKSVWRAHGCNRCFSCGYAGRTGVFELLVLNERIRALIMENACTDTIAQVAREQGMVYLKEDAFEKLKAGLISPEEFFRVVSCFE